MPRHNGGEERVGCPCQCHQMTHGCSKNRTKSVTYYLNGALQSPLILLVLHNLFFFLSGLEVKMKMYWNFLKEMLLRSNAPVIPSQLVFARYHFVFYFVFFFSQSFIFVTNVEILPLFHTKKSFDETHIATNNLTNYYIPSSSIRLKIMR
jgi:hypothetical protein